MIIIGKWIIDSGYKHKIIQFIHSLINQCQQIENNDLKQKQSVMIKRFKIEWNLI